MRRPSGKTVRDAVIFLLGAAGFVNEAFVIAEPRPILLAAALLMMGVTGFMSYDRLFQRAPSPPEAPEQADPKTDPHAGAR